MSKQKNLTAFFKPVPVKRTFSASENDSPNPDKKIKIDSDSGVKNEKIASDEKDTRILMPSKEQVNGIENGPTECKEVNSSPSVEKKPEKKVVTTPLGLLTPLQCLAKIKSQCAKTQALHPSIGHTWYFALQQEFQKPYFAKLSKFIVQERAQKQIFPPEHEVWTWTTKVPIKDVKVVILGQDPYHNPGQAHGLSFSVPKGVPPPPSLVNMYKELSTDIPDFSIPNHGYLNGWAEQGVLMLNACLTVRAHQANSHKEQGWEELTDAVIRYLSANGNKMVFMLWGSYAQKKGSIVDKKRHLILKSVHPSPLSAHRGFFGCKHFSQCNSFLEKVGRKPINWGNLP